MIPAEQQVRSRPAEVDPDTLRELHEWFAPQRPFDDWAAEYVGDLAIEIAEGQR